jgi:hypothetical protein
MGATFYDGSPILSDGIPAGMCRMCWRRWHVHHKATEVPECASIEGACVGKNEHGYREDQMDVPKLALGNITPREWIAIRKANGIEYSKRGPVTSKSTKKKKGTQVGGGFGG